MIVKALVAVRSGSVRVENKNLRPFAGSTLLEVKLEQLKKIGNLDGIIVNSNDQIMLDIAQKFGCEAIHRDQYYASNSVSMSDVYEEMARNCDSDIIVYANCTNPLIKSSTIFDAIEQFKEMIKVFDSLNSAHLVKEFLFKDNKPINYNLKEQPRSQDLPDIYALNFAVNVISREKMIKCKNVVGNHPLIYGIDEVEGWDIDNPIDFEFAEMLYKKGI